MDTNMFVLMISVIVIVLSIAALTNGHKEIWQARVPYIHKSFDEISTSANMLALDFAKVEQKVIAASLNFQRHDHVLSLYETASKISVLVGMSAMSVDDMRSTEDILKDARVRSNVTGEPMLSILKRKHSFLLSELQHPHDV